MAGMFEDLIPQQMAAPQASSGGMFSDLIPQAAPQQTANVPLPPERPQQSVTDKLLGVNGPRYQLWPERAVRGLASSAADFLTLPGQVVQDATTPKTQISDSDVSPLSTGRALNAAMMATPVNPVARMGDRAVPGAYGDWWGRSKPEAPTSSALFSAGKADIQAAKDSGLVLKPEAAAGLADRVQQRLFGEMGIHPVDAPATYAKLQELQKVPDGATFTAANLQSLRKSLQKTAQNFNPAAASDQAAASIAIKELDGLLPSVAPADVLAGSPTATAALFERGRGNAAAAYRSGNLTEGLGRAKTGILERAEGRAAVANSGRNVGNTIRSKVESLLEQPKQISGFNDQELAGLQGVAAGSRPENTARYIGNFLGGGGGLGAAVPSGIGAGIGATLMGGSPVGAAIGAAVPVAAGYGLKSFANSMARKGLLGVDAATRMRSPLYQEALGAAMNAPRNLATNQARNLAFEKALGLLMMRDRANQNGF